MKVEGFLEFTIHGHSHYATQTRTTPSPPGWSPVVGSPEQVAEMMRQGQAETEARIAMTNMVSPMSMNGQFAPKVNPLIEYFAADPVVCELEIDIDVVQNTFCSATFKNPCMYLPCLWPHCIILGLPASLAINYAGLADAARSHRLILRQNSIMYEVKSYPRRLRSKLFY